MKPSAELTRRRLLDAAVEEFSQYGPDGARTDRIADRAGVNKERLFAYFGKKHETFAAVLEHQMTALDEALPLTVESASDLGRFAAALYDFHAGDPSYLRLLLWEALTAEAPSSPEAVSRPRVEHYERSVAAVAEAQRRGALRADLSAPYLLYTARALAVWWLAVPLPMTLSTLSGGDDPGDRRDILVELVRSATVPR